MSRDMFSRIVYGARVSVTVGFGAMSLAISLTTLVGVTSAYFGGKYDIVVQRVVDAFNMLGDALRHVLDPRLRGSTGGAIR